MWSELCSAADHKPAQDCSVAWTPPSCRRRPTGRIFVILPTTGETLRARRRTFPVGLSVCATLAASRVWLCAAASGFHLPGRNTFVTNGVLRDKTTPAHTSDECAALLVWKPSESPTPLEIHGPPALATAFKHAVVAFYAQLAHYSRRSPLHSPQRFESLCGFNLSHGETTPMHAPKFFRRGIGGRAVYRIFSGGSPRYSVKSLLMRHFFCAETQANRCAKAARNGRYCKNLSSGILSPDDIFLHGRDRFTTMARVQCAKRARNACTS